MKKEEMMTETNEHSETKEPKELLYNPSYDNTIIQELMMGAVAITLDTLSCVQASIKYCTEDKLSRVVALPQSYTIFEKKYNVKDENGSMKTVTVREMAVEAFHNIVNLINGRANDENFLRYIKTANVYNEESYDASKLIHRDATVTIP